MAKRKDAAKRNAVKVNLGKGQRPAIGNGKKKKGETVDYATAYRAALMNPFSPKAQGARVPDMYAAPTVPKHISQSYSLFTNNTVGMPAQLVILPNLYMPLVCPIGSVSGSVTWRTMDDVSSGLAVVNPTSTISSQLTNYRIVGYGVRVYSTGAITSTSGRVMVATNPVSSWVNYKSATIGGQATTSVNLTASAANTLQAYGLPIQSGTSYIDSSALGGMQNCTETSLVSLASNPMVVTPKVNSPEAFEFRQAADSAIGFSINNQTSATYVSSGDASYLRVAGHELVVISVIGAPVSTGVLQVEVVYHIEGTPTFSTLSGETAQTIASPGVMADIISAASRSDPFKQGLEMAGNVVLPGLGTLVRNAL